MDQGVAATTTTTAIGKYQMSSSQPTPCHCRSTVHRLRRCQCQCQSQSPSHDWVDRATRRAAHRAIGPEHGTGALPRWCMLGSANRAVAPDQAQTTQPGHALQCHEIDRWQTSQERRQDPLCSGSLQECKANSHSLGPPLNDQARAHRMRHHITQPTAALEVQQITTLKPREVERGGGAGGGGGGLGPKICVPKMARQRLPNGKFRFFPRWSLWSGEGGGTRGVRPFEYFPAQAHKIQSTHTRTSQQRVQTPPATADRHHHKATPRHAMTTQRVQPAAWYGKAKMMTAQRHGIILPKNPEMGTPVEETAQHDF